MPKNIFKCHNIKTIWFILLHSVEFSSPLDYPTIQEHVYIDVSTIFTVVAYFYDGDSQLQQKGSLSSRRFREGARNMSIY